MSAQGIGPFSVESVFDGRKRTCFNACETVDEATKHAEDLAAHSSRLVTFNVLDSGKNVVDSRVGAF